MSNLIDNSASVSAATTCYNDNLNPLSNIRKSYFLLSILVTISGILIILEEFIPYKDAIGGGLFTMGLTMAVEEYFKAREKCEHIAEVNERIAISNNLKMELTEARKEIDALRDPSRKKIVNALRLGNGFGGNHEQREYYRDYAEFFHVTNLYFDEASDRQKIKQEIANYLHDYEGVDVTAGFQLAIDLAILGIRGFYEGLPPKMNIFSTSLNLFKVKPGIIDSVDKYWDAWYARKGVPECSKLYFLLLWDYLANYNLGYSKVDFQQNTIGKIENLLIKGHELIDEPSFCREMESYYNLQRI